ncbi:MAG: DUF6293 family protein [Nitrososphaerales archaeon]
MVQNTIQIATFGEMPDAIVAGLRNFPIHKLALLCYEDEKPKAEEFARRIRSTLGIPVSVLVVSEKDVIREVLQRVAELIKNEMGSFEQILMNVSAGDKMIGCAALSAAFVNGMKAFGIDQKGSPMLMPILKLSYSEIISDAKLGILRSIDKAGGEVESLEKLSEVSHYGKPLLSYHVQGARDSRGLADLGLVEVKRAERGKITVKLTTLGKLLIASSGMTVKT